VRSDWRRWFHGYAAIAVFEVTDVQRLCCRGCHLAAEGRDWSIAARMDSVGEQDDVGVALRIDPEAGAGKAGVPKARRWTACIRRCGCIRWPDGREHCPARTRIGRVDVPAEIG